MEVEIFKALDFLYCEPENPVYETVLNDKGMPIIYRMVNIIKVCNQFSFVPAIKHPEVDWCMLVYDKYPVYKFLLKPVGKVRIK